MVSDISICKRVFFFSAKGFGVVFLFFFSLILI